MAQRKQANQPAKRTRRKPKQKGQAKLTLARVLIALSLVSFLLLTVGTVGYVIFFRTVIV